MSFERSNYSGPVTVTMSCASTDFGRALDYVVEYEGETFDAKALYGIAYGLQYPDEEPIRNRGLQGGRERQPEARGARLRREELAAR